MKVPRPERQPLPKGWTRSVKSALVQITSLAQFSLTTARGKLTSKQDRLTVTVDRLEQELALLNEELQILHARLERVPPHKRPHYTPIERLAILELRAARGWNVVQTAERFLVTPETIISWYRRIDEQGTNALLQMVKPVNRFPELVRYVVQRLKRLCPRMGTRKIAEMLCRAGLHLGAASVRRFIRESPSPTPDEERQSTVVKQATAPNQVWHVDLTTIPIGGGFWAPWLPFTLPQCWPFCWWIAVVVDHFSRRAIGFALFDKQPTSIDVRRFLGRAITQAGAPDTIVCDRGMQFIAKGFKSWCQRREMNIRYGAIGKQGSIAVVERFIRTMKEEGTRRMVVALERRKMRKQLNSFITWYNHHRPHSTLKGATPDEVYFKQFPANRKPRLEPRPHWPRGSPCARPQTLVAGQPGDAFELVVEFHDGQRHLPVVTLKRAA